MSRGRLKTKSILEVFHHTFDKGIGAPCKYLIVSLMFFDMLNISTQEVLCRRHLLVSENLSYDGVTNMVRFSMYNNHVITVSGHIIIVVSFIAHPDVASCHGREKTKGC